jgi:thiol-disulfide isomerase/thioredoxin
MAIKRAGKMAKKNQLGGSAGSVTATTGPAWSAMLALLGAMAVLGGGVVACGSTATDKDNGEDGAPKEDDGKPEDDGKDPEGPGKFEGGGQTAKKDLPYPTGNFGLEEDNVITNYEFLGWTNPSESADKDNPLAISFAHFYNPSGDGDYPADSIFTGKLPKALVFMVKASWCGPCRAEEKTIVDTLYPKLKACGAEVLLTLADGPVRGQPADMDDLEDWTSEFGETFPSAVDPGSRLSAYFPEAAFPAHLVIDTKTMEITWSETGGNASGIKSAVEDIVGNCD